MAMLVNEIVFNNKSCQLKSLYTLNGNRLFLSQKPAPDPLLPGRGRYRVLINNVLPWAFKPYRMLINFEVLLGLTRRGFVQQ